MEVHGCGEGEVQAMACTSASQQWGMPIGLGALRERKA